MTPKHAQLQVFIQVDITDGKKINPAMNNYISLVVVL